MPISIYLMHIFLFQTFIPYVLYYQYLWIIDRTALMIFIHNIIGFIVIHQVPLMIIVEHNRYHIINLILMTDVSSILMIEQHEMFLPEICMIREKWTIKVALIVVYQPPT